MRLKQETNELDRFPLRRSALSAMTSACSKPTMRMQSNTVLSSEVMRRPRTTTDSSETICQRTPFEFALRIERAVMT